MNLKELIKGEVRIIYKYNSEPYGIRNDSGYVVFFTKIQKYPGQEKRYQQELERQAKLADYLLSCLKGEK